MFYCNRDHRVILEQAHPEIAIGNEPLADGKNHENTEPRSIPFAARAEAVAMARIIDGLVAAIA